MTRESPSLLQTGEAKVREVEMTCGSRPLLEPWFGVAGRQ